MAADPYGLAASGLPPELMAKLQGLTREQAMAQLLMEQANAPLQAPQNKGRFETPISPLSAIAKVAQAYMGSQALKGNDKRYADLANEATAGREAAMRAYEQTKAGTPGVTPLTPNDDEGNAMPSSPGVPGDPRKAVAEAMLSPYLRNSPLIAADLKKTEPNWKVEKSFDPKTGQETQVLVNLNNPGETRPFGGVKTEAPVQVTTTGPDGRPVTSFVNPRTQTAPLPQPVKMEMKDTGKVIVPSDPYAPVPLGKTTTPDADQSRTTQLQVHGLGADGLPTGDVRDVAKGIAEGRLPPLTSFAMGTPRGQAIMSEVTKINPTYSAIDFHAADKGVKDFSTGKQGNSVRSFNVAISHLGTLEELSDAMHNGDTQIVNRVANQFAKQTGEAAPVNFEAAKKIVGDEIVKAIVGSGGGVADREEAAKTVASANSPAQLKGVIKTYKELMRGQLGGLRQQYEQSTGRKDFDRFLSADAVKETQGRRASDQPGSVLKFDAQGNPL